jgi:hypothetical protein
MSPVVILVFAPVVVLGVAFYALLLGAVAAGVWEAVDGRAVESPSAPGQAPPLAASQGPAHSQEA